MGMNNKNHTHTHARAPYAFATVALALSGCFGDGDLGDPCEGTGVLPGDTLEEFSAQCFEAIGLDVPAFNCDDGTLVPEINLTGETYGTQFCDAPNVLNAVCDPESRFQVLAQTDQAIVVAHCRKKGLGEGLYGDIAVIQYNQVNGNTCYYQALGDNLPAEVTAPSEGIGPDFPWYSPAQTANVNCVRCHDNGPFIRSPYLAQLRDVEPNPVTGYTDRLPGTNEDDPIWGRRFDWNQSDPYNFIGYDFQSWKVYAIEVEGMGATCTGCHRMGISKSNAQFNQQGGSSLDFGLIATAEEQAHKNDHSENSPIWMLPGQVEYLAAIEAEADAIASCARAVVADEGPLPEGCSFFQYGGGDTCELESSALAVAPPQPWFPAPVDPLNPIGLHW